jgi:hypothetical protein
LLGVELEPGFRVLSATIEPADEPAGAGSPADGAVDRRLLVVTHPVSTILAALVERGAGGPTLRTFEAEHLPDVVTALEDAPMVGPFLGLPEPRRGSWGPRYSLEGRSSAPDGTRTSLTIVAGTDALRLSLYVRCDVVELRTPSGVAL